MRNSMLCLLGFSAVACFGESQIVLTPVNVIGSSGYYTACCDFAPGNIFDDQHATVAEPQQTGYWLNPDNGPANAYILIDLGAQYNLASVELYNTHNSNYYDRGTGGFTIEGSNSLDMITGQLSNPQLVASGTLSAIAPGVVGAPILGQTFSATGTYQYLEFLPTSVASGNASCCGTNVYGLNELKVFDTATTPEPSSIGLLAGGLCGIAWLRRRQVA